MSPTVFLKVPPMHVVIFGQMGNGKSTFAKFLTEILNAEIAHIKLAPSFKRGAFAKGIKESIANKFGVTLAEIEQWKGKPEVYPGWKVTMREALQREGNQAREIKETVWVEQALRDTEPVVIDDGRHYNELEAARKANAYCILMFRPNYYSFSNHPSESEVGSLVWRFHDCTMHLKNTEEHERYLGMFNEVICNDCTLDQLRGVAEGTAVNVMNWFITGRDTALRNLKGGTDANA